MGRLDLPDPIRDEDIHTPARHLRVVSGHDLCKTRLCVTNDCPNEADSGSDQCYDCNRGLGIMAIRNSVNAPHDEALATLPLPPRQPTGERLTEAELATIRMASAGHSIRESAWRLGKSRDTVAKQRHRAMQKLGALNIHHAVALAFRKGLLG